MASLILLGDIAGKLRMLEIACCGCSRRGRLSVERLLREHGPALPVYQVWENLNRNCPRRDHASVYKRCRLHAPNLARVSSETPDATWTPIGAGRDTKLSSF